MSEKKVAGPTDAKTPESLYWTMEACTERCSWLWSYATSLDGFVELMMMKLVLHSSCTYVVVIMYSNVFSSTMQLMTAYSCIPSINASLSSLWM